MRFFINLKPTFYTLLLGLSLTFATVWFVNEQEQTEIKQRLKAETIKLSRYIQSSIEQQLFLYNWMAKQWIMFGRPDPFLWHQQAKHITQNHKFLQAVIWADKDKVIRWVEPLIGNQLVYNYDLNKVPIINEKLNLAAQTGQFVAVGNWKLMQGMKGLLIYIPIGKQETHQGYVVGVIKQNEFLQNAAQQSLESGYQFKVNTGDEEIFRFYGENEYLAKQTVELTIDVFGTDWVITLWPSQSQLDKIASSYSVYIMWIGLLLSVLFAVFTQLLISAKRYSNYLNKINKDLEYQIQEREKAEENLLQIANFDELTGLPNRSAFHKYITDKLRNQHTRQVSVILIDLDHFKDVNDILGHTAGDTLLEKVSNTIKAFINAPHYLSRIGGDEFAIYVDDVPSLVLIQRLTRQILSAIDTHFIFDEYEFSTSASIGYVVVNNKNQSATELLRNADSALNKAKEKGKNCIHRYTDDLLHDISKKIELMKLLRQAIEEEQFELYFQPKINIETHQCIGFEALIRWHHPVTKVLISPVDFIAVAEESGLIVQLGEWIFEQACTQLKIWHDLGFTELTMAINVSGKQIQMHNLYEQFHRIYTRHNLPASTIEIELTEQVFIENIVQNEDFMRSITDSGISLSIDDFGVGYSSLSYLKNFPVNTLKIDRSFIQDLPHDYNDVSIVQAIINLAKSMDLKIVAEGVENTEQLDFLKNHGCHIIQGYYFSKPLPSYDITNKLLNNYDWFNKQ